MFDEIFGKMPGRPSTPDFRRLVDIVLRYTGEVEALPADERNKAWEHLVGKHVDLPSITYMALQRALRPLGITTQTELTARRREAEMLVTVWLEGFMVGCEFQDAGGKQ